MTFNKGAKPCFACEKVVGIGHCFGGRYLVPPQPGCTCNCHGCYCEPQVSNGLGSFIECDHCKENGIND